MWKVNKYWLLYHRVFIDGTKTKLYLQFLLLVLQAKHYQLNPLRPSEEMPSEEIADNGGWGVLIDGNI